MSTLHRLIRDPQISIEEIAAVLNAMPDRYRRAELGALKRGLFRLLYEKAAWSSPLTLSFFSPAPNKRQSVISFEGFPNIPTFPTLRSFRYRLCRAPQQREQLVGYHDFGLLWNRILGPGYFVVKTTHAEFIWHERGAVVFDACAPVEGPVPGRWPALQPNTPRTSSWLFHEMRLFWRRISKHVAMGAVWKEQKQSSMFVALCRDDS
ncbi:MAG: hypothetical protein AAGJ35_03020 [Myxococcota bacterium]